MTLIKKNIVGDYRPVGTSGFFFMSANPTGNVARWVAPLYSRIIQDPSIGTHVFGSESTAVAVPSSILLGSYWQDPEFTFTDRNADGDVYNLKVQSTIGNTGIQFFNGNPLELAAGDIIFTGTGYGSNLTPNGNAGAFTITPSGLYSTSLSIQVFIKYSQIAYWGASSQPTGYSQNFIKSLSSSGLVYRYKDSFSFNVPSGQYGWYAHRSDVTGLLFRDQQSNMIGGWSIVATGLTFVNGANFTDSFDLYRTDNHSLGNLRIDLDA